MPGGRRCINIIFVQRIHLIRLLLKAKSYHILCVFCTSAEKNMLISNSDCLFLLCPLFFFYNKQNKTNQSKIFFPQELILLNRENESKFQNYVFVIEYKTKEVLKKIRALNYLFSVFGFFFSSFWNWTKSFNEEHKNGCS